MNSRYVTPEYLQGLMKTLSYTEVKKRWKSGGKMAYWLYQKSGVDIQPESELALYQKKEVIRQGNRNNFSILL
jgi:25S rRNA (adenine2142-N1)-methyltransferase